jgi:hypothetical protein
MRINFCMAEFGQRIKTGFCIFSSEIIMLVGPIIRHFLRDCLL